MNGYIKDFRKELDSDIWLMPPLYHRVWQYLKYKANFYENRIPFNDGSMFTIKPGQHLTSLRGLAEEVGWYEGRHKKTPHHSTISKILKFLEKQKMIEVSKGADSQYTLITLLNWDLYQSKDETTDSKPTVNRQTADESKNDKECLKNDKDVVVGNAPAREIPPQPDQDPVDQIADHFMVRAGKPGQAPRASSYHEIKSVLDSGIGTEEAIRGTDEAFNQFKPKYDGDEITSFAYCKKVILENHFRNNARKEAKHASNRGGAGKRDEYEELSL